MSPFRPEIVECWVFRVPREGRFEVLLIRRSAGRIFPGLWQCVTGGLGADETIPIAALREVEEETGLGAADIEAFYDLDQVASFYSPGEDTLVTSVMFAARVRRDARPRLPGPGAEPARAFGPGPPTTANDDHARRRTRRRGRWSTFDDVTTASSASSLL